MGQQFGKGINLSLWPVDDKSYYPQGTSAGWSCSSSNWVSRVFSDRGKDECAEAIGLSAETEMQKPPGEQNHWNYTIQELSWKHTQTQRDSDRSWRHEEFELGFLKRLFSVVIYPRASQSSGRIYSSFIILNELLSWLNILWNPTNGDSAVSIGFSLKSNPEQMEFNDDLWLSSSYTLTQTHLFQLHLKTNCITAVQLQLWRLLKLRPRLQQLDPSRPNPPWFIAFWGFSKG